MANFEDIFGIKPTAEREQLMNGLDDLIRLLKLDCRRIIDVFEELKALPPPESRPLPQPSAN